MAGALLLGTTELASVDGPLQLPDRFLSAFADGGYLTLWLDGCLALWPRAAWSSLADRVLALPMSAGDARAFRRMLFASAIEFEADRGRVVVPEDHRRRVDITAGAVLVGAGDHAELWDPARWARLADQGLDALQLPTAV
jgi:MraZ protein